MKQAARVRGDRRSRGPAAGASGTATWQEASNTGPPSHSRAFVPREGNWVLKNPCETVCVASFLVT